MKRLVLTLCLALAGSTLVAGAAQSASKGAVLCVGSGQHCYTTIQAAVDAAHDGDTIQIGLGTFAGGISIDKSISLTGAGPLTTIRGGGPVLTIGVADAATEPTVSLSGMTISGGDTHGDGTIANGGGIDIPAAADFTVGATVSINNTLVVGNRADPTTTAPIGPPCPAGRCPFAQAQGGGIYNAGTLTLNRATVTDNVAAGVASDADGGGIFSVVGALTVNNSLVAHNQALAVVPNGRFAEGGGLFVDGGSLTVRNAIVSSNSATLTSHLPVFAGGNVIDMNANSGGIHVSDGVPTTVENTAVTGNTVTATDLLGEPIAFDAGMLMGDSQLHMRNTLVTDNQVIASVATSADVGPSGTALELDGGGTISNTRISGNSATENSPAGAADVSSGLAVYNFNNDPELVTVQDSIISGNTATASSTTGSASAQGAGIFNNSLLDLRNVQVAGNAGKASGPTGVSQGGGIWNGVDLSGPPVQLTLENTLVTHNSITGSSGITLQGGGLFTTFPVTLTHSLVAANAPDQCFGC